MYEKQVQQAAHQIKNEDDGVVSSEIATTLVPQQPAQTHQQLPVTNAQPQQLLQITSPQEQQQQQLQQQPINDNIVTNTPSPNKDTSSETIDVTTVPILNTQQPQQQQQQQQQPTPQQPQLQQPQLQQPQLQQPQLQQPQQHQTVLPHQTDQSNLSIVLNGDPNNLKPHNNDPNNVSMPYNREIPPPNSIYGIESLTSKPYDADIKQFNDSMQSPRFQSNYQNMTSPHHSSPDRATNNHRTVDNNWVSPVKNPFRGLCPPTNPYIDRDGNMVQAAAAAAAAAGTQAARRFMPPFYGTGGRNFIHNGNDRSRYGNYPVGSPMMSTLGYPRDTTMDSRYNLHIPPTLGGFEDDKFKLSPPSIEDKHIWTKQEVELLLDLYEEHKSKLQDPRVRKTKVWDDIAKQIHDKLETDVNGCQCNQKFRNMKADYQKVVEHNARAGSFRKTCKYYDRLEKLLTPISEADKFKSGDENNTNGAYTNGFGSKAGTPNGTGFYDSSRSSTSSEDDASKRNYENGSSGTTPSSPEKRTIDQVVTAGDDASPPPSKRPCNDCNNCGSINKKDLIDFLKDFLKEQRKRDEDNFSKIQILHKEKLDAVVKFIDLFQELVKKV